MLVGRLNVQNAAAFSRRKSFLRAYSTTDVILRGDRGYSESVGKCLDYRTPARGVGSSGVKEYIELEVKILE